jgi:hypothetical protein
MIKAHSDTYKVACMGTDKVNRASFLEKAVWDAVVIMYLADALKLLTYLGGHSDFSATKLHSEELVKKPYHCITGN